MRPDFPGYDMPRSGQDETEDERMKEMCGAGRTKSGLRRGYTTGSCAAAAAKAATRILLTGEDIRQVSLTTPSGTVLDLEVERVIREVDSVECAVRKYSGDDPDVTDGLLICAQVRKTDETESGILLDGGEGVGRVTRPGLEQEIGQAAINRVPRRMIREAVAEVCAECGYEKGMQVTISVPGGAETAKRTFNPRLGIQGGLSILGTTGIVEPMSEKALTDTIWLEMKMLREKGRQFCCIVPGNYGMDFLTGEAGIDPGLCIKCSNFIGEALDDAVLLGFDRVLLAGHAGKLIKLAAGVMNTHSRQADCRMEVIASHAAMAGAGADTVKRIMNCINTTEAFAILREEGLTGQVMKTVMERIEFYIGQRTGGKLTVDVILFSKEEGILGATDGAERNAEKVRQEDQMR